MDSKSYIIKVEKLKVALAVFLLIIFISLISVNVDSWSLSSNNFTSGLTIITGGGITDTNSTTYQTDIAMAQSITGSTNSSLFSTMLGFFFSMGASINQPPTISGVDVTPDDPKINNDLTCTVTGWNDGDGDSSQYHFDWYNETIQHLHVLQASNVHVLGSGNTTKGETWKCTVTPYDGTTNGSSLSDEVIINNTIPTDPTVVLNATTQYNRTSDNLTVWITDGTDVDGDPITNITDWRKEGVSIATLNLPFDTNHSSVAKDYSTLDNNGTINGATWTSGGRVGGAYDFDGSSNYISLSSQPVSDLLGDQFTFEFWANPGSVADRPTFGFLESGGTNSDNPFASYDGGVNIGNGATYQLLDPLPEASANQWTHYVFVDDGSKYLVYINGVEDSNPAITINPAFGTNRNFSIAQSGFSSFYVDYFNGIIDAVFIYNHSLSPTQINVNYVAGLANHSVETIHKDETSRGDNWTVAVTPNDGYEDGNEVISNEVEIINNLPTDPTVVLSASSSDNLTSDNLSVAISGSSDINEDSFVNITDWRKEGVSIAVLNLPFDTEDSSIAKDYSTYDNNGSVSGATWTSDGKVGGGYSFEGDDYIQISPSPIGKIENTISLWFKVNSHDIDMGIMETGDQLKETTPYFLLQNDDGVLKTYSLISGYKTIDSISTDIWYHITIIRNSTYEWAYLNGVLKNSVEINTDGDNQEVHLGVGYNGYFNGSIDDVIFYNYSLSNEQINESYLAGYNNHSLQKIVSNETNLGDNWTVAVTPNDGYGDGNTVVSNTVKILLPPQTPPTDPTVVLSASSGDNLSSDNLSVVISGSSDINGDSFVNITDWRKEGVSIALLNFPFDTNHSTTTSDYTTSPYDISNSSGDVNWVQSGRVGGAYEFNDNDDGYFYSTENRKMAADNLTLMIWAKPKGVGTGNYNGMFFLAGMFRTFLRTDGRITIQIYNSTNNANNKYSTGGTIPYPENYGTWRHIAITLSQGTVTFYTNGQEDGSGTWTGGFYSDEASSLYIGAMQTNQYEFNGTLDEFFIFNRTLSAEQINESYLAGLANHSLQKIVSNETSVGENWSVAVTTNDGYGDGNMVVSNNLFIDIDPEPPTDPTVVLSASSSDNLTSDNLSVAISGSSDINEDSFVNITDWRKEGVSIAVLNLPFDTEDSSIAKDYSTYDNNGSVSGATWTSDGKVGGGYSFEGDDYIQISPSPIGKIENTISLWFKVNSHDIHMGIMETGNQLKETTPYFLLQNDDGVLKTYSIIGGYKTIDSISTDIWYHITIIRNSTYEWAYLNGVLKNSVEINTYGDNQEVHLGVGYNGYFNGSIDEVKLYNYSLSAEQINESYLAGLANHSLQKIVSNETSVGENWSVAVTTNDGYGDGNMVVSNTLTIANQAPSKVTLVSPANGSDASINRTQILNWSAATDPESDDLTYEINVTRTTFTGEPSCSVNSISESSISILNYTTQELCVDDWYDWKVRANDGTSNGEWSDIWNFSVQSYISVNLLQGEIDFAELYGGDSRNTSDNSSAAFKIENAGNVKLNFTIYGNKSLWIRDYANLNTTYFQFKANNSDDESGTFNTGSSQMDWTNVTNYAINLLNLLDYNNTKDTALIDVLVNVPEDESGGSKNSTLMITSSWG